MYNSIRGVYTGLEIKGAIARVYLDQNGLEWAIEITRLAASQLPEPKNEIKLYTYLHHSEDQHCLYGFASVYERIVFLELLKVQGIGPRAALKILSGTTPQKLTGLLEANDVKGLEKIPGLGMKTAQKILLTLQGKLILEEKDESKTDLDADSDLLQALIDMGYDKKIAADTVKKLSQELVHLSGSMRDQEILRRAIIMMS